MIRHHAGFRSDEDSNISSSSKNSYPPPALSRSLNGFRAAGSARTRANAHPFSAQAVATPHLFRRGRIPAKGRSLRANGSSRSRLRIFYQGLPLIPAAPDTNSSLGHLNTSQWPPFAGPTRRKRPDSCKFRSCFSMARVESANCSASSEIVIPGSAANCSRISASVFSELFSEPFSEPFSELLTDPREGLFSKTLVTSSTDWSYGSKLSVSITEYPCDSQA